ncbi:MAG: hypothetical protein ABI921_13295 [Panacibacter sp.]
MMKKICKLLPVFLFIFILVNNVYGQTPQFKVLVVASLAKDHVRMIDSAAPFLKQMATENNFNLDFTKDTGTINDANLANYDVFIMLHLAPFDMSYKPAGCLAEVYRIW